MSLGAFHVVDDDGTRTLGTIANDAWLQTLLALLDARWSIATITLTGNQHNLAVSEADLVIFNNATLLTVTGIAAPSPSKPGKPLRYICIGAGQVNFTHQDSTTGGTGSTAANRLVNIATSGPTPHVLGGGMLVYDSVASRWRLVAHEQGAWITNPFNAADYTATTGTWTMASGSQNVKWRLRGRTLEMQFSVVTSTVSSITANLFIKVPGAFTAVGDPAFFLTRTSDAGAASAPGMAAAASGTVINLWSNLGGGGFAVAAGNTAVQGSCYAFEVT